MAAETKSIEIVYSYARKDRKLRDELDKRLGDLKRRGQITSWYDREITAGTEWAQQIDKHLNTAQIILLLVSPDFIASDYCYSIEMTRAIERHDAKEARVIPVILRPTDWERAPFGKLLALPTDRKPITKWLNRDESYLNVAQGIRKVVDELNAKLAASFSSQHQASSTTDPRIPQQDKNVSTSNKPLAVTGHINIDAMPNSVFLFNQPLPDPGEFYGRVRERGALMDRIRNGASTSIVGPRRVGKTWLMSYLSTAYHKFFPSFEVL